MDGVIIIIGNRKNNYNFVRQFLDYSLKSQPVTYAVYLRINNVALLKAVLYRENRKKY